MPKKESETIKGFYKSIDDEIDAIALRMKESSRRLEAECIKNTIVFFGSAQTVTYKAAQRKMRDVELNFDSSKRRTQKQWDALDRASNAVYMSRYYHEAEKLAYKLGQWSKKIKDPCSHFFVCSGGGPGIMEAANKGASRAGVKTIGLGIDIHLEQTPNFHITPELTFCFDHFLVRKYWFFKLARAVVIFPGGLGTLDEVFELLTLIKTRKLVPKIPLIFYGTDYWKDVLSFEAMIRYGVIDSEDVSMFHYSDDVGEAFDYITNMLIPRVL